MMLDFIKNLNLPRKSQGDAQMDEDLSEVVLLIYNKFFKELMQADDVLKNQSDSSIEQLGRDFENHRSNQDEAPVPDDADDIWIFGYGSLVWKADFPYIDKRRGYICSYKRRFYQHSVDHRGVPEKPGRVVTLLPSVESTDRVYGVAYRIAAVQKYKVLDHLDYREKNGYERCKLKFYEFNRHENAATLDVIIYVATQENDSYAGHIWRVKDIAEQIFSSAGPSGPNREYLFKLHQAMSALFPGVVDEHMTELVTHVRNLIKNIEPIILQRALTKEITKLLIESIKEKQSDELKMLISQRLEELYQKCQRPGTREVFIARELCLQNSK